MFSRPFLSMLCAAWALAGCGHAAEPARCPSTEPSEPAATAAAPEPEPAAARAIPYDLPKAGDLAPPAPALPGAATHSPVASILAVEIQADGSLSVDGKIITGNDELIRIAKDAHAADPEVRAIVRADRSATWGMVVRVIDLLKQGGVAKLAFAVSPLPTP